MKLLSIILLAGESVNGGPGDEPKTKCQSCEQLASGILALMEKTKKANFGGGNTRWEEKSLGKWAISETRLLEITENACGGGYGSINLQSMDLERAKASAGCHHILEQFEDEIEEWFLDEPEENGSNFREEFCVKKGAFCCPKPDQFGPKCKSCPKDNAGEVCSGHGKCRGAGDKKGSGKCECKNNYKGPNCRDCADNHYRVPEIGVCARCSTACLGCTGPLTWDCESCAKGYYMRKVANSDSKFECTKRPTDEL